MSRTANLRRQHDAAVAIVVEMRGRIDRLAAIPTRIDAYALTMLLAKLGGVLRIHLAQEDKLLYPRLMRSPNADVAETAHRFVEEMGQIGAVFADYAERWRFADAIIDAPEAFARESAALFKALGNRIERENTILYPLADRDAQDDIHAA